VGIDIDGVAELVSLALAVGGVVVALRAGGASGPEVGQMTFRCGSR